MLNISRKGFTLVELIVSIGILAIITTVGSMSYISYIQGTRDVNRVSQLDTVSGLLDSYRTIAELPLPENPIEIKDGSGNILAYQGVLGEKAMELIKYSGDGLDPLTSDFFTYEVTNNRKKFQLIAFLEDPLNSDGEEFIYATGIRYPYVTGDKLGILTDSSGVPINENELIKALGEIDLTTAVDGDLVSFVEQKQGVRRDYSELVNLINKGGKSFGVVDGDLMDYKSYIVGTCGADDSQDTIELPTLLCNSGIPSIITDNGVGLTYNWNCDGILGGTTSICTANHLPAPVNGVCGTDNGLDFIDPLLPILLCNSGIPSIITDNGVGLTYNWSCDGINGGADVSCNATHIEEVCNALTFSFEDNTLGTWNVVTGTAVSPTTWTPNSGTTGSSGTGPSAASDGSYYIYTETSSSNNLKTFIIEHDITCQNSITFDYHAYGATIGTLLVQEFDGVTWSDISTISGQQQSGYASAYLNTNVMFTSGTTKVRLHYTSGSSYTGDFAIDNIVLDKINLCAVEPVYPNAIFSNGNPLTAGLPWQNTVSANACYYECNPGFAGNDCNTALQCDANPGYSNATFIEGIPLVDLSAWQNTNSGNACYYVCTRWFTGYDCSIASVGGDMIFSFETNTLEGWVIPTISDRPWIVDALGTPSGNTGPLGASDGTYYIFPETSGQYYKSFIIDYDLVGTVDTVSFDYHAFGAAIGELILQGFDGTSWVDLHTITGQQQTVQSDPWLNSGDIAINQNIATLRLFYTSGSSYRGDFAIDNIVVSTAASVSTNGECGTDNGLDLTAIPTNTCSAGIFNNLLDGGIGNSYTWECLGENGGTDDLICSANHIAIAGDMELTYNISDISYSMQLPFWGDVNITNIDWGDSVANSNCPTSLINSSVLQDDSTLMCSSWGSTGLKSVKVYGTATGYGTMYYTNTLGHIISVDKWDTIGVTNYSWAFYSIIGVTSLPPLESNVIDTSYMLYIDFSIFVGDLSIWDVSNVNNMKGMFMGANLFNQNISGWGTSSVTNMDYMFSSATNLNQDLSCWNVQNIPTLPTSFATSSALTVPNTPVWGTVGCP